MKKIYIVIIIALFTFNRCKTIKTEKPREVYIPSDYTPKSSNINLPIDIDIKKIEQSVNEKFNGLIYEDNNFEDDNLELKLWKNKKFAFSLSGTQIQYRLPLKIWSKFGWKIEKLGISISDNYEVEGEILLKYKTNISITKEWKIQTNTIAEGYEWITKPSLNALGVKIPISNIASIALTSCSSMLNKQIDKTISQSVPLKELVEDAWINVQNPFNINTDYDVWVKISPNDISIVPIKSSKNILTITLGIKSIVESFIGHKPETKINKTLPNLIFLQKLDDRFVLNFTTDITFDKIGEIAKKELIGKEFSQGKKKVIIKNLDVYGSEGKMMFMAEILGSIKGTVYFTGVPTFNKENNSVEIVNIDFDLKTKNVLLKSANWLLHGTFLKLIEPNLKFPLDEQIKDIKTTVNKEMTKYQIVEGIVLSGIVSDIVVDEFVLVKGALKLIAHVEGKLNIKIEDIKF